MLSKKYQTLYSIFFHWNFSTKNFETTFTKIVGILKTCIGCILLFIYLYYLVIIMIVLLHP